jgi:type I restriction enzyme, R subunit
LLEYSEQVLVEQPAIALFNTLGWQTEDCYHETLGPHGSLGRDTRSEVVLLPRLRAALRRLNPGLPEQALELAVDELTRDRSAMSPANANRDVYRLLKDGVRISFRVTDERNDDSLESAVLVRVIDWHEPANNDFFLASQFWISGDLYTRRTDLLGFVNGLPLVFVELKASHRRLENAYNKNLADYRDTIPRLFWYNALIILSNGSASRVGTITAAWEHFAEWKKISNEGEQGIVSLDTILRGTCDPARLLDLVENFILYQEAGGGLVKVLAKNHQYLGVNAAVEALRSIESNQGRLGVFWHTQGSGKSVSMIFFAQKTLRRLPGAWTFLIVTDRQELDDQIYKNFASSGAVTEQRTQAESSQHLRELLHEDHRYIFTLIQKFRTEPGQPHPLLSTRSNIIVMTDEAHRSQYDIFALNMRTALPEAAFIGFTGTPLMAGEERTRAVFGEYVSIYNFRQSIEDGATVPLYYENRIPELALTNRDLNVEIEEVLDQAALDEAHEHRLAREFAREYQLITRDDRLDAIARDLVSHFTARGERGKAMVIAVDKATAVRMYNKVRAAWAANLTAIQVQAGSAIGDERDQLFEQARYLQETDMAVVVSQGQNEIEEMRRKGLDILPHRRRMVTEDLDTKFKDANDPFRIVFVCAMWMTGFDVPSCSVIYLDKPMRNHTLMQTIARANRVLPGKTSGLIVDYIGVFRNLQRALAIYGTGPSGAMAPGDFPVKPKDELVALALQAVAEGLAFCSAQGIDAGAVQAAQGFARVELLDRATDSLLTSDQVKAQFLRLADDAERLARAILPDPAANQLAAGLSLLRVLAGRIRSLSPEIDVSGALKEVEDILDRSVSAGFAIRESRTPYDAEPLIDLSRIDLNALRARFQQGHKHIEAERIRAAVSARLSRLVRLNRSRLDYLQRYEQMIADYNAGAATVDEFFQQLLAFNADLSDEERRGLGESLTEEELAVFDLLTKPQFELTKAELAQVKSVARDLLGTLKREKLVLDWRKRQQTRAAVRLAIEEELDKLPSAFNPELYRTKCDLAYQHVYDSYFGQGRGIYAEAS